MSFTELKAQAMRLRPAQRAKLVSVLVEMEGELEEPLTVEELDRRAEDLRSGRVKGVPAGKMISAARKRLAA